APRARSRGRRREPRAARRNAGRPPASGEPARRQKLRGGQASACPPHCFLLLRSNAYFRIWFVILPPATTLILPCHGVCSFLHGGCVRPGGGLVGLNRPPND